MFVDFVSDKTDADDIIFLKEELPHFGKGIHTHHYLPPWVDGIDGLEISTSEQQLSERMKVNVQELFYLVVWLYVADLI